MRDIVEFVRAIRAELSDRGASFADIEAAPFRFSGEIFDAWHARGSGDPRDLVSRVVGQLLARLAPPELDE